MELASASSPSVCFRSLAAVPTAPETQNRLCGNFASKISSQGKRIVYISTRKQEDNSYTMILPLELRNRIEQAADVCIVSDRAAPPTRSVTFAAAALKRKQRRSASSKKVQPVSRWSDSLAPVVVSNDMPCKPYTSSPPLKKPTRRLSLDGAKPFALLDEGPRPPQRRYDRRAMLWDKDVVSSLSPKADTVQILSAALKVSQL